MQSSSRILWPTTAPEYCWADNGHNRVTPHASRGRPTMRPSHNSRFKLAMGAVAAALALVWATQGQWAFKPAPVGQPTAPVRPTESAGRSRNLAAPEAPQAPE